MLLQLQPPGFNLIWLPYCDDLRRPEMDDNLLGADRPANATERQISAAAAMVEKLQLPDFEPCTVPNPHLQRSFQVPLPLHTCRYFLGEGNILLPRQMPVCRVITFVNTIAPPLQKMLMLTELVIHFLPPLFPLHPLPAPPDRPPEREICYIP